MKTILVVDDDIHVRVLLAMALSTNYIVIAARNGQEGLAQFQQYNPDLIITDLDMPVLNGIDFVRNVRAISTQVKIIAHASFPSPIQVGAMLRVGADLCLPKPANLTDIEQAIDQLLAPSP